MGENYEVLTAQQQERAAAFEIAAKHTAMVAGRLAYTTKHVEVREAAPGGMRKIFAQILDGKTPDGVVKIDESSFNQFEDVTMRAARWINSGHDSRDLADVDEGTAAEAGEGS